MFKNRTYRKHVLKTGLCSFGITVKETNLHIQADTDLTQKAVKSVLKWRGYIESHIQRHPSFFNALAPVQNRNVSPGIITEMEKAAGLTGVGPMAAVAGAIAEFTGKDLLYDSKEVIVENGGDIFIKSDTSTTFHIYAGHSPLSMQLGVLVEKRKLPFGLCTSSGTFGHSKSFGTADAVTVLSDSTPLADAAATSMGNLVKTKTDIEKVIEKAKTIQGIEGIIVIKEEKIGLWGNLQLVKLQ